MKTIIQNILLLIALLMVPGVGVHAEESNNISQVGESVYFENVPKQPPSIQKQNNTNNVQLALIENNYQYVLVTASLYAFSLITITFLMKITTHRAADLITIIGLLSVIFGTILLVLVVDTTETLTAPMGIFGAIAGYLFGSAQKKEVSQN